ERHLHRKDRSLAHLRLDRNMVAEEVAHALHDRKPEPQGIALFLVVLGLFEAREFAEDLALLVFRDTLAGVPHLEDEMVAPAAAPDEDLALRRIADGVRHQVV